MKRLGGLLYFDIMLLFVLFRPWMYILELYIERPKVLEVLYYIMLGLFGVMASIYVDKGKRKRMSNMTKLDVKIWRVFQYILFGSWGCHVLSTWLINPKSIIQPIILLIFYIVTLSYFGIQIYFLRTKKW